MVPSPEFQDVWKTVSEMRQQLKDPGYYRWPPHANLLYPFLELEDEKLPEILEQLHSATRQCPPFNVSLNQFGTFGGKQRGVLWLFPDSSSKDDDSTLPPPLMTLHDKLEEAFPICKDQIKGGRFSPHMTISHFKNLDDALAAQEQLETDFPNTKLDFAMDRIYLLERKGDGGQFLRVAEVGLGSNSTVQVLDPPQPFPDMPAEEEDWVHEERMKLKARRNKGSSRGSRGRTSRPREPRVPDTPEEIARKRAERKAKRERLEQE
jgi:2'-5' RNA ligase